jgi:hypothetical protein
VPDQKGTGRNHHHGRAPDGKSVRLDAEHLPHKTYESANQVGQALCIEHSITADMDDGQSLPPYIDDGIIWWRVCRLPGNRTLWRRLFISSSSARPGAALPEDRSHAP